MKKFFAFVCLAFVFVASTQAQTAPPNPDPNPPLCGISHTDYQTGEVICDDGANQTNGISHTDAPEADLTTDAITALLDAAAVIISVTGN